MNYKILFQKLYVVLIVLLAVVVHLAEPVEVIASDASGDVDGSVTSFGFNNPVEVSRVQIMNASGATAITSGAESTSLTRVEEFRIEFDVFDLDGFQHLDVYVVLFNNNSSTRETLSGVMATAIDGGVTDNAIVYRWMSPERSTYLSGLVASGATFAYDINSGVDNVFVKLGSSGINEDTFNSGISDFISPTTFNADSNLTWQTASGITSFSTVMQSGLVTTLSGTQVIDSGVRNIKYKVSIPFILSKVAPSSGVWNVGVMVHDRLQQEIEASRTEDVETYHVYASNFYENQFYGEVEILNASAISFTNVPAAGTFQTSDQSGLQGVQVRFISNGTYNQSVQTDSTWTPTDRLELFPKFAYLTANSGLDVTTGPDKTELDKGNRFALRARRTQLGASDLEDRTLAEVLPAAGGSTERLVKASTDDVVYRQNLTGEESAILGSIIAILEIDTPTSEVGRNARFEFALRLSQVFQNTTYNGNISIGISNDLNSFFNPSS